jgi:hypothetical protein
MKLYHVSSVPGLTELQPFIPRVGTEENEYDEEDRAVYLCPENKIEYWKERLKEDHLIDHPYVYEVNIDPSEVDVFTDVFPLKPGEIYLPCHGAQWFGYFNDWAYDQFWIKQSISCVLKIN